jgi:photosystem II stability/assembly factor-like uncharacterized protein
VVQYISDEYFGSPFFLDENLGWAVGGGSSLIERKILKTENGGENWTEYLTGVTEGLESVFFIDENTGWIVGTSNTILKSVDGGRTWFKPCTDENITGSNQFTSIHFNDHNKGFIAGWFSFLTTIDGGENWKVYQPSPDTFLSVFFINSHIGWRVGTQGSIQKTIDGGDTWQNQSKIISREELIHVDFVDELEGWVISNNSVFHTQNGGYSWALQQTIPQQQGSFNYVFSVDSLTCWVVGYDRNTASALILKTLDGGNHWNKQKVNYDILLNSACFINENMGWVVGESGIILFTENGGVNWMKQESGTTEQLTSVDFINSTQGWVSCMYGNILYTVNGGEDWFIQNQENIPTLRSIDFVDSQNGWGVGGHTWFDAKNDIEDYEILGSKGYIFYTKDGGENWDQQVEEYSVFSSVKFLSDKVGWATGGNLWCTNDGGENWIWQKNPICGITSVDFIDLNTGWLVGINGAIVHTTTGGVTFSEDPVSKHQNTSLNFILHQNYPNPFNPTTTIEISLPINEFTSLKIYNLLGREVATLVSDKLNAGNYKYEWNASEIASGVYYYRLAAGEYVETKKLVVLK